MFDSSAKNFYCFFSFCKPGKVDFVVKTAEPKNTSAFDRLVKKQAPLNSIDPNFYVHEFLASYRDEPLPYYPNPRRVLSKQSKNFSPHNVFAAWKNEDPELLLQ